MEVKAAQVQKRFEALAESWLSGIGSANTRDAYRGDLTAFAAWCAQRGSAPLRAGTDEVEAFRDACSKDGVGPSTVARRLSGLSSFYDHATRASAVPSNPVVAVDRPAATSTSHVALDEDAAAALLLAARALGPKVAVLVALLLLDGMKMGEALTLDVEDLSPLGRGMRATLTSRGATRTVPLDPRTARAIVRHLEGRREGALLRGDSPTREAGWRLTRFGADFLLKQASQRAGLGRNVSANTLRRSYIAGARSAGAEVEDIQDHVGHGTARETRRYLG